MYDQTFTKRTPGVSSKASIIQSPQSFQMRNWIAHIGGNRQDRGSRLPLAFFCLAITVNTKIASVAYFSNHIRRVEHGELDSIVLPSKSQDCPTRRQDAGTRSPSTTHTSSFLLCFTTSSMVWPPLRNHLSSSSTSPPSPSAPMMHRRAYFPTTSGGGIMSELRGVSYDDDDRHVVETAPNRIFQDLVLVQRDVSVGHQGDVCVSSPEELQSDQPT